jgi:drug/metabolite transporter (DMT)-like permease
MDYLYILLADILLAVVFTCNKVYQKRAGADIKVGLAANFIMGAVCFVIFSAFAGFKLQFSAYSIAMAILMMLAVTSYTLLSYKILSRGKVAIYVMFLMAGGMVLPYVWGLIFGGEAFSALRTIGLLLIIVAVVFINFDKAKPSKMQIMLCVFVFVLNGCSSIVSKTHQDPVAILSAMGINKSFEIVDTASFVALVNLVKAIVCLLLYIAVSIALRKKEPGFLPYKKGNILVPVLAISAAAVADGVSYYFQLLGPKNLDAGMLYPLISGGSIVLTALAAFIAFREKPSKPALVGIAVCIMGMCLFI